MVHYEFIVDVEGKTRLTSEGVDFLQNKEGKAVQEIDFQEGLLFILQLLADLGPSRRKDLFPSWQDRCHQVSNMRKESGIYSYLGARLVNLEDRKYVKRDGVFWIITNKGKTFLDKALKTLDLPKSDKENSLQKVRMVVKSFNDEQKSQLKDHLSGMNPYQFEKLIKVLLEKMGYENVKVTNKSNDKGVDVVGNIQVGITEMCEVVQVKRQKNNVQRPIIDQLRGVLHRFDALRGTIITLSDFSKGSKEAAKELNGAPVTLIDGDKLIDLMFEHQVGVVLQEHITYAFDEKLFSSFEEELEE